jgi:NitT/TauT family transport system substrate-binding protein
MPVHSKAVCSAHMPPPEDTMTYGLSRRTFVTRMVAVGVGMAGIPTLLTACSSAAPAPAKPAATTAPPAAAAAATTAPASSNQALRTIKFTHGGGLCNMPLFYGAEKKLFETYGIRSDVVLAPVAGDQMTQLVTGKVDAGVVPFTNAIAGYVQSPVFQIVAGSGIQGLIIVGQTPIKSWADLRGKKIGTFQADTLDIVVYDYLKKQNMTYQDVKMQYFGDTVELNNAFIAGQLDALSTVEPYATQMQKQSTGNRLGDGIDIYGAGYPDCVLAVRNELIQKDPALVKDVIRTFFDAEYRIESDFPDAAKTTIDKYYKTDMDSLIASAKAQPPGIDIRDQRDFMYSRAQSMKELNYIQTDPDQSFIDFTLLNQVIKESPDLWSKVKVHAKTA